jgi:hypothetical protein
MIVGAVAPAFTVGAREEFIQTIAVAVTVGGGVMIV